MSKRFELAKKYTEKYKSVLKPCKYCGNKNIAIASDRTCFPSPGRNVWSVVCSTPNCDCTGTYVKVADAVKAWNIKQEE